MSDPMNQSSSTVDPAAAVKVSRFVVMAMAVGVVGLALAVELGFTPPAKGVAPDNVLFVGLAALLLGGLVGSILLPQSLLGNAVRGLSGKQRPEIEAGVARAYQIACVLRAALLESPALFGVMVVMMTGNALAYIAPGVALLVMLVTLPSRSAINLLIERAMGRSIVLP